MVKGSFAEAVGKGKRNLPLHMFNFARTTERELKDAVQRRTPRDTGRLRNSVEQKGITRTPTGFGSVYRGGVHSDVEYASFVEDDTAPHIIRPKLPHGYLRFYSFKLHKVVELKIVHHPGTTGVHMFAKGAADTEADIDTRAEAMFFRWKQRSGL